MFNYSENTEPISEVKFTVSVEKHSKGFNYSVTVTGTKTFQEAFDLITDAQVKLAARYSVTGE